MGSTLIISDVLTGILQILPFNFGNCPLGIIALFLNRILREISTHSSLFKFDKMFGTNEIFKLFEIAGTGIHPFFNVLWHVWHMQFFYLREKLTLPYRFCNHCN